MTGRYNIYALFHRNTVTKEAKQILFRYTPSKPYRKQDLTAILGVSKQAQTDTCIPWKLNKAFCDVTQTKLRRKYGNSITMARGIWPSRSNAPIRVAYTGERKCDHKFTIVQFICQV